MFFTSWMGRSRRATSSSSSKLFLQITSTKSAYRPAQIMTFITSEILPKASAATRGSPSRVTPSYPVFIECLLYTIREADADHWSPENEAQWRNALQMVCSYMV